MKIEISTPNTHAKRFKLVGSTTDINALYNKYCNALTCTALTFDTCIIVSAPHLREASFDLILPAISKHDIAYMDIAARWSQLSHAKRLKVGAIIVNNNQIISDGYNGMPSNMDNVCELPDNSSDWRVLHAESNAILKAAKYGSAQLLGSTLYVTHSPCKECAKLIYQAGIVRLLYVIDYRDTSGLDFLNNAGICIQQIEASKLHMFNYNNIMYGKDDRGTSQDCCCKVQD